MVGWQPGGRPRAVASGEWARVTMAAVKNRRSWLLAGVIAWIAVIAGFGIWSVTNDPPTVQEQRSIADALPILERAAGAVFTAASAGDDRAVELGALEVQRGCRVTPVRDGVEALRRITVYVRANEARHALDEIADGLPRDYAANTNTNTGGKRIGLEADAGGFVAVDARADAAAQAVQIEVTTGCRPDARLDLPPTTTTAAPAALQKVLTALGSTGGQAVENTVACPAEAPGGSSQGHGYSVGGLPAPQDLGKALQSVIGGVTLVRSEPAGWAYVAGGESVSVVKDGAATVRASVTTRCG